MASHDPSLCELLQPVVIAFALSRVVLRAERGGEGVGGRREGVGGDYKRESFGKRT